MGRLVLYPVRFIALGIGFARVQVDKSSFIISTFDIHSKEHAGIGAELIILNTVIGAQESALVAIFYQLTPYLIYDDVS